MLTVAYGFPLNEVAPTKKRHTYTERDTGYSAAIDFPVDEIGAGYRLVQPVGSVKYFTYGLDAGAGQFSTDDIDFCGILYRNVFAYTTYQGDYYHVYRDNERITTSASFGKSGLAIACNDVIAEITNGVVTYKVRGHFLCRSCRSTPDGEIGISKMSQGAAGYLVTQTHRQYEPRAVVTETETVIPQPQP